MGTKPKHPCIKCKVALIARGDFCESCRPRQRTSRESGYNPVWDRKSKRFLRDNPFCCDPFGRHRGQLVDANVTGHRIPHRGNVALLFDESNWFALCWSCNSYQSANYDGGFGRERTEIPDAAKQKRTDVVSVVLAVAQEKRKLG